MSLRSRTQLFRHIWIVVTGFFLSAAVSSGTRVQAQDAAEPKGQCVQAPVLYQLANYTVKDITIKPMLKFIPGQSNLQQALAVVMSQPGAGLAVGGKFDTAGVSLLESDLNVELERRTLTGKMGLIFARHKLINCDEEARTLEVQYQVLTVARPSYLTTSYEANDRKDKSKEAAGNIEEDRKNFGVAPFAGYNRSRGIFGGADLAYETDSAAVRRIGLDASASGSSGEVAFDTTGSKNLSFGPLNYAEWKAVYRYSDIPADGFSLKEATLAARLFVATRPLGPRNLLFRAGVSVEGGHRQSTLPQEDVSATTVVASGYGALKAYVGASMTSRRQDLKASYALQLGNDGNGTAVGYRKHIFDSAYRLRFLPASHKPFQFDFQFTAGSLQTVSGFVPHAERFFGGNAEQEFIQDDSWRIRSNPFIRSFPQNRLNGTDEALSAGGDRFISINFTVAQTIWQKQLIPDEIAKDPDVNAGLGGQLLFTRLFLREQAVQESTEMKQLEAQAGCSDESSSKQCLTPVVNKLKTVLNNLLSEVGSNDELKASINSFFENDDGKPIGDVEDAIAAAKLDPKTFEKPVEDAAALASIQNNPVEGNVNRLIKDDLGDPDDSDDDMLSLITVLQSQITKLNAKLTAPNFAQRKNELQSISGALESARTSLQTTLKSVDLLRAYQASEIEQAKNALTQPSASGRALDEILTNIKALLKTERDKARTELEQLNLRLSQLTETDPEVTVIREKREALLTYRDLLDASDTYADKAKSAYTSAQESFETKDFYGTKIDLERLTVGFGGLYSYLSGLDESIRDLQKPLKDRGLSSLATQLNTDISEALSIQKKAQAGYNKLRVPKAEVTANKTVSYVGRVLGVFFREANLVGIAPVVMFDAARLRVFDAPDTDRFRYGVGGGIRFSLVNVDFTAGYSINPTRRLNEPRGALVLRMDINDLF